MPGEESCRIPLALLDLLLCQKSVDVLSPFIASRLPRMYTLDERERTKALIVPCSACRWFRLNLGSVPLSDGYRKVFGFLIL